MAIAVTPEDKIGQPSKSMDGPLPTGQQLKASLVSSIRKAYQASKNTQPNSSRATTAGALVIAIAAGAVLLVSEQSTKLGTTQIAATESSAKPGLAPPSPPATSLTKVTRNVAPADLAPADLAKADLAKAVGKAVAVSAAQKIAELVSPIQVSEIQRLLAKLDFRPGPPDGVLGHRTVKAIRLYQKFSGLEITGHATPELLLDMRAVADRMPEPKR